MNLERFHPFLIAFILGVLSCGAPQAQLAPPAKEPVPGPGPGPKPVGKPSFAEEQQIMQKYCIDCHASAAFTKSETALIASTAKNRVQNATMPPPYSVQMSPADKARFVSFF